MNAGFAGLALNVVPSFGRGVLCARAAASVSAQTVREVMAMPMSMRMPMLMGADEG